MASLAFASTPSGIAFNINGIQKTTPYAAVLAAGDYTITMPATVTLPEGEFVFESWENRSTDLTRTVTLTTVLAIHAQYSLVTPPPPEEEVPPIEIPPPTPPPPWQKYLLPALSIAVVIGIVVVVYTLKRK